MSPSAPGSALRCLAVGVVATAALGGLAVLALPAASSVRPGPGRTFDELLVGACAVVGLVAGAWLWLVSAAVVVEAMREGPRPEAPRGVPRALRRLVLAACGVALVGAGTPAVAAEQPHPLHGLPMPERATSTAAWVATALSAGHRDDAGQPTVVVRPGDTLWHLAAADLSPTVGPAAVTRRWHRLHTLNRAVIGDDPDLIHPGQRLQLPPTPHGGAGS